MKNFANMFALERRLEKSLAWEGYHVMRVGKKRYTMTEYGPGPGVELGYSYVYFSNRNSGDSIHIRYDCPTYNHVNGKLVQTKHYRFIDCELIEGFKTGV